MTDNNDATSADDLATVATLIKGSKIAMLTTVSTDGSLASRPLQVQEAEFDGDLWFFTQDPSPKTIELQGNPQVNVSFDSGKGYLSVSGTAELSHDRAKIDQYWSKGIDAWFPNGKEDPTVALIHVTAHSAEFWSVDEPKPVTMFKIAKSAVTGKRPDIGENRVVDLDAADSGAGA